MDAEMTYDTQASSEEAPINRIGNKDDICENGAFYRLAQPPTHDTSHIEEHATIEQLGGNLESAVKAGWPRAPGTRYTSVKALFLSWEDDDLGVIKEIRRLRCVLENKYHYNVQTYEIPSRKPDTALKRQVLEFLDDDDQDMLMIVYYGGHARRGNQVSEGPLWFANRENPSNAILSSGIQSSFEQADADVLLLYDCCHSAAMTTGCHQSNTSVTEVIAACAFETFAAEVDEHSFTNALINTLALASKGPPFSVAELNSRILSRLRSWTPSLLVDDDGNIREDGDGEYISERQPRRTPIYNILCESKNRRSIILTPRTYSTLNSTASSANICPSTYVAVATPGSKKRKVSDEEQDQWPQIILSIRLDSAQLEIDTWREYIRSLPAEAKDIKIEGVWKSFSTLLMVRMPVTIWNLLPDNGAYSFVGFVTSDNLAYNNERSAYNEDIHQEEDPMSPSSDTPQGSDDSGEKFRDPNVLGDSSGGNVVFDEPNGLDLEALKRLNLNELGNKSTPYTAVVGGSDPHGSGAEIPRTGIQAKETSASDRKSSPLPLSVRSTNLNPRIRLPQIPSAARSTSNPQSSSNDRPASSRRTLMDLGAEVATSAASIVVPAENRIQRQASPSTGDGLTNNSRKQYEFIWIWTCCSCGHGGMSTGILSCPGFGCGHLRCMHCPTESHKRRKET